MSQPDTCVFILNWNGGTDTASCIRSVLQIPDVAIWVFDNGSTDDSLGHLSSLLAESGLTVSECTAAGMLSAPDPICPVRIIRSPENIGFSRAINIMLRALPPSFRYVWLLNNDVEVVPATLEGLKTTLEASPATAFAGSVILDFDDRNTVQSCGVDYYRFFGVGKLLLKGRTWNAIRPEELSALRPAFQHGASLLVRTSSLPVIGFLDEHFFLYAEEHDWQVVAAERGCRNELAASSIVFHKGSVSTHNKRHLFYYYYNTSSVYFSRKHYPAYVNLIATLMLACVTAVRTSMRPKLLFWGLKGILNGWKKEIG